MHLITSNANGKFKQVCLLQKKARERKERGCFVVEGVKMVSELIKEAPRLLLELYYTEDFASFSLLDEVDEEKRYVVTDKLMRAMSETMEPQGVLAVASMPVFDFERLLSEDGVFLALDTIQDPGNLGTILRTAEAAGIRGVFMSGGTVDVYNPKVVRSTMGSILRMPHCYVDDFVGMLRQLKARQVRLYAAHLRGEKDYREQDYKGKVVLLIGNEANGLSDEVAELADIYVKIPMKGRVESLNAAIAAALLSYEACGQSENR